MPGLAFKGLLEEIKNYGISIHGYPPKPSGSKLRAGRAAESNMGTGGEGNFICKRLATDIGLS